MKITPFDHVGLTVRALRCRSHQRYIHTENCCNTIVSATRGIRLFGGNTNLEITGNSISSSSVVGSAFGGAANTRLLVSRNQITGNLVGTGIGVSPTSVTDSEFSDNVVHTHMDGIVLLGGNTRNTVCGNVVEHNGRYGINANGATGNTFKANQIYGNPPSVDARDTARASNTWSANQCNTDDPAGTICGVE